MIAVPAQFRFLHPWRRASFAVKNTTYGRPPPKLYYGLTLPRAQTMIDIIPNWHPIFVHFTVGLLLISALFHIAAVLPRNAALNQTFTHVANWNLWVGATLSIATVAAGWLAFNSVTHDTPSHEAMLTHRNWAVATFTAFLAVGAWSIVRAVKHIPIGLPLVFAVCAAGGLLISTAWHGGELVYRHGLGVMSLPNLDAHGHGEGAAHDHDHPAQPSHPHDDGQDHSHDMSPGPDPTVEDSAARGQTTPGQSAPDQTKPDNRALDSSAPPAANPDSKSKHTHPPGQEHHEH